MRGGESLARQIRDPVTELIETRHEKAIPIAIDGVANRESGIEAVTVFGEVWGI